MIGEPVRDPRRHTFPRSIGDLGQKVDDAGLHITVATEDGGIERRVLDVDHVVVCAGQESVRGVYDDLSGRDGLHLIGGADVAAELDAKRAIDQGTRTAFTLPTVTRRPDGLAPPASLRSARSQTP